MAVTAAVTFTPNADVAVGQAVQGFVTVSNSGPDTAYITDIKPHTIATSGSPAIKNAQAVSLGKVALGGAFPNSIANGANSVYSFAVAANAPVTNGGTLVAMPSSISYDLGCTIQLSDGSTVEATTAALAVHYPGWEA